MNFESITTCDVCNGDGIGVVLWVSGCDIYCPGCHNKETWDPKSGSLFTQKEMDLIIEELKRPEITRFTISGGHPLMPCNREKVKEITQTIKNMLPEIKIWLYTGYNYKKLDKECKDICKYCDVIVDGPYKEELRDTSIPFRGSTNQKIIKNY